MNLEYFNKSVLLSVVMFVGITAAFDTRASDDDDAVMPSTINVTWQKECSACHIAYPPSLLHADSWREIMAGLNNHFGDNASLPTATADEIRDYLIRFSGNLKHTAGSRIDDTTGKPITRITKTRWFYHAHDEISQRTWKNPKVKSPANCAACHTDAERGDFNEHHVKIPK